MASYNKRAKWIEGITQSNRILRDIAEIVTTAIRTEDGVSQEENWELVYPRPFQETIIDRGRLIKNPDREEDAANVDFIPIEDVTEYPQLMNTTGYQLEREDIVESTLRVTSEGGGTVYEIDTDYEYNSENRTITRIADGGIPDNAIVRVIYGVRLFSLLPSAEVTVYERLTVSNPYREIPQTDYELNRSSGSITFTGEMPENAQRYLLTFSGASGIIENEDYVKVELEIDYFDPNEKTYKLPAEYGRIRDLSETIDIASTSGGTNASGLNNYTIDAVDHKLTFTQSMKIGNYNELTLTAYEFIDSAKSGTRVITTKLIHDPEDSTNTVFLLDGTFNELNPMLAHSVTATITSPDVELEYELSELDAGVDIIEPHKYRIDHASTIVTFLDEQEEDTQFQISCIGNGQYDLNEGIRKIKNRIVLKTITQPETDVEQIIGTDYGARDTDEELEMYVEMRKPDQLIHPETGMNMYSDYEGSTIRTQLNNHYIETRMFDKWDDMRQQPTLHVGDEDGNIAERGAYVSEWSKYSWFKDWKEYLVDEIDSTPGSSDISKGVTLQEVKTPGMTDEFPIQFWISTNNNRIAMVLMGDPTLDQDNFLTSFAYLGRIHPFFDTECAVRKDESGTIVLDSDGDPVLEEKRTYFENDVRGNFALTVGSSTIPANVSQPPSGQAVILDANILTEYKDVPRTDPDTGDPVLDSNDEPIIDVVEVPIDGGDLYDGTTYSYLVTYLTPEGESRPSERKAIVAGYGLIDKDSLTQQRKGITNEITFRLPDEASGYRIYRAWSKAAPTRYIYTARVRIRRTSTAYWEAGQEYSTTNPNSTPLVYNGSYNPSQWTLRIEEDFSLHADVAKDISNWKQIISVEELNTVNRTFTFTDDGTYLGVESTASTPALVNSNHATFNTVRGAASVARGYESVIRDLYTGAILDVQFSTRYGRETATGVNDIAMFQTRSGLKYQKHNPSFITTEEFMKKERSGQSRWTGKFHLSPIYLEHSYDKQRGWLDGVMAVDDAGIEHLDELIVGKDTPNEEVYKFFRINAPYSFFNNSANYAYGIAIIKSSMKWD